jgi:hypothetical protein
VKNYSLSTITSTPEKNPSNMKFRKRQETDSNFEESLAKRRPELEKKKATKPIHKKQSRASSGVKTVQSLSNTVTKTRPVDSTAEGTFRWNLCKGVTV